MVVLICHALLVQPALVQAHADPSAIPTGTAAWWAAFSPLHLAWAGLEAVFLFFVLSGFVLTLPFVRKDHRRWAGYYPKRLVRLYLPVWGAFVLAFFWMTVLPRQFSPQDSIWLRSHARVLSHEAIRNDLLLFPLPFASNSALWSLRFEVIFSLLLPVFIFLGRQFPRLNLLKLVLLVGAVVAFSNTRSHSYFLLPMFGVGALMALERQRLASWGEGIRTRTHHKVVWWVLTLLGLLLLNSYWTVLGLTSDPKLLGFLVPAARGLTVCGACLVVFLAIEGAWRGWLEKPALQWLGKRSFSLYLVHEPIVVSVAVLFGGLPGIGLTLAVAVPLSLAVAEVFYRMVENPSQRLSRRIEARIEAWRGNKPRLKVREVAAAEQ